MLHLAQCFAAHDTKVTTINVLWESDIIMVKMCSCAHHEVYRGVEVYLHILTALRQLPYICFTEGAGDDRVPCATVRLTAIHIKMLSLLLC